MSEQLGASDQQNGVAEQRVRQCPFCKEEIRSDAIKCKHCGSRVTPERLAHEGICPYCKEEIDPEAVKCKYCKSTLNSDKGADCGCKDGQEGDYAPSLFMPGWRGRDFGNVGLAREMMVGPSDIPGRSLFQMGSQEGFPFGCRLVKVKRCGQGCINLPWGPECGIYCWDDNETRCG
jgi:uncharacterized CHY-type Zn-finger protein